MIKKNAFDVDKGRDIGMLRKGLTLHVIISVLVLFSVLLSAIVIVFAAREVSRSSLSASYLEHNQQYAEKLAMNTEELLQSMQTILKSLAAGAGRSNQADIQESLDHAADMLGHYFNSVLYVDETGKVLAVIPPDTGVQLGSQLTSEASRQAIELKKPLISKPYQAITGRLIILISHPVFDRTGHYRGFIGGTLYLEKRNILNRVLQDHFYQNGSYVYVVDQQGELIFHPDKERLGDIVAEDQVINKLVAGKSGSELVISSKGIPYFAGYAYEPLSGWGIVSQTPVTVIQQPSEDMIERIIWQAIPFFVVILFAAWFVARHIAKPLHQLAAFSESSSQEMGETMAMPPETTSGIYEVRQLYQSFRISSQHLNTHLDHLHTTAKTDGLTGLANRRAFDLALRLWGESQVPFALIMLDIDHFKKVNDTYGHLVGDEVLKELARTMMELSREGDECFRYGGEEFSILVQYGDKALAWQVAERLRERVATAPNPTGQPLTVSLGIALYPEHAADMNALIACADNALYQSKTAGRNRTTLYQPEG